MSAKLWATLLVVGSLLATVPLTAHHSFAAEFDEHQPVTLKGTLTRFDWVNPHGWLYVDVKEPDGRVVNWAIEAGAPNALLKRGAQEDRLSAGLQVVITRLSSEERYG